MPSLQGLAPAAASPAATPDQLADALCTALAQGHNIPAHLVPLGDCTVVSLWYGLTARCGDGRIWWTYQPGHSGRRVLTFASSPVNAAARLAQLYAVAIHRAGPGSDQPSGPGLAGFPRWSMEAAAAAHLAARERP